MKRITFNQYIRENDFKGLFITEMGWNRFRGQADIQPIEIDNTAYCMTTVAERNGFQIITCPVQAIPTTTTCRKIDYKLRRSANDYICIFYIPDSEHHLWIAPVKTVEKRDIVTVEYETADKADFLFAKIDALSFDLGEVTTIVDVKERIQGTFAVNSEKITKDFYAGFKKEHKAFADFITGIDDHVATKDNRNKQWYTSVMLNRLMFCYFIQKKGFLNSDFDYLQNKLKWVRKEQGEDRFFQTFYKGFLSDLFHDGLNAPRHDAAFERKYGRIPYLNGGMFDEHQLERDYADIDICDEAFIRLFNFFDTWRWHLDTRITASGKDINPDVLGYIFEQYINDRAQMGAYYTKEDITEYIGKNCIIPFLIDKTAEKSEKAFAPDGFVWQTLRESGDRYIYDAVKKGYSKDWMLQIPDNIAIGIDTTKPDLLERRSDWNTKTAEKFALPTEIWRETIERLQRCESILNKIQNGEITRINDFITYNLDIRSFAYDLIRSTDNHLFVLHFYKALQGVTILDPTCGSGAFLFAAMNILEPLYEVCIERMQEFKRVAVVEVERRADNLGLDPLPDIDFNIRCGNTLVGYATEEELNNDLTWGDIFANQEFKEQVEQEMQLVAMAYETFKHVQFTQEEDMAAFKQAKWDLKQRLASLNELLNRRMHASTGLPYDKWLSSHQPFHWLAEFYQIIKGNGGFDVIIGNPPYVEYSKVRNIYQIKNYITEQCGNLYAYVLERCYKISNNNIVGMIVPTSSISTERMKSLQTILFKHSLHYSTFGFRPAKLFDGDTSANIHLSILLSTMLTSGYYATSHIKWNSIYRPYLFQTLLSYSPDTTSLIESFSKVIRSKSNIENNIIAKLCNFSPIMKLLQSSKYNVYYRTTGGLHYRAFTLFPTYSKKESILSFENKDTSNVVFCVLASNLWNLFYYSVSNCLDVAKFDILNFPFSMKMLDNGIKRELISLSRNLNSDIKRNSEVSIRHYTNVGDVECYQINMRASKSIIDNIDKVLSVYYGFTEEELDFIINYDIKYRMGDELNE